LIIAFFPYRCRGHALAPRPIIGLLASGIPGGLYDTVTQALAARAVGLIAAH